MATRKKARGKRGVKGHDIVRMYPCMVRGERQWYWSRYSVNSKYVVGSWPETFHNKSDCRKSAERAMTKCPIVEEK